MLELTDHRLKRCCQNIEMHPALTKRQYARFAFYKIDPAWRGLPPETQVDYKRELLAIGNRGANQDICPMNCCLLGAGRPVKAEQA